jgi:RimJ/RimL family protein N-acetyltransferase
MVDPAWQGAGLATLLHRRTQEYAARHGVRGLTADVLQDNGAMLKVFRRADHDTKVTMDGGVCEVRMLFRHAPAEGLV